MTADSTNNTVDNPLEITIMGDADWKSQVETVKINSITLTSDEYSLTADKLTINQGVIKTAGTKVITIIANGYIDSSVTQLVNAGAFSSANSSAVTNIAFNPGVSCIVTLTAKDQYKNPISNYQFKYDVNIDNINAAIQESYTVDGQVYTAPSAPYHGLVAQNVNVSQTTDDNGAVEVHVVFPSPLVNGDGGGPLFKDASGNLILAVTQN